MITFTPFKAEHILGLQVQDAQKWTTEFLDLQQLRALEGDRSTTLWENGKPILCTGVAAYWHNRGMVWSFVGSNVTRHNFLEVHNLGQQFIDSLPFDRLELYVDVDFRAGHRWAKALGFEMECERMKKFQVNGGDCALYAKVRV